MRYKWLIIGVMLFLVNPAGFSQSEEYPFSTEIRQFRISDSINPVAPHAILFAGSSSFTLWKDVQDYFPGFTIINRGFGGSTIVDQIHYADDVIFPYSPRQIVIYCGENDLAYNDSVTGKMVCQRFINLFHMIKAKLPDAKITYLSMKPSPSRWILREKMQEGNNCIMDFLIKQKNTGFINVWDDMLDENSQPDPSLFLEDMLHMNNLGYQIWQKEIMPDLLK